MQVEHAPCVDPAWQPGMAAAGTLGTAADAQTGTFTTYNFEVATWHTYFAAPVGSTTTAAAIWVHNLNVKICPDGRKAIRDYMKQHNVDRRTAIKELFETDKSLFDKKGARHTLFGDETGGGHFFPGKPGKSPFPKEWSPKRILDTASDVITDPSVNWSKPGRHGYVTAEKLVDGIKVKVVFDPKSGRIITAHPTNVRRNP